MKASVITVLVLAFMSLLASIFLFNYYQVTWDSFSGGAGLSRVPVEYKGEFDLASNKSLSLELCSTDVEWREATGSGLVMAAEATTYQWFDGEDLGNSLPEARTENGKIILSTCPKKEKHPWRLWNFGVYDSTKQQGKLVLTVPKGFEWQDLEVESLLGNNRLPGDLRGQRVEVQNGVGRLEVGRIVGGLEAQIENQVGEITVMEVVSGGDLLMKNQVGSLDLNKITVAGVARAENEVGEITIGREGITAEASRVKEMAAENDTGSISLSKVIAEGKIIVDNQLGEVETVDCEAIWEISNDVGMVRIEGGIVRPGSLVIEEGIGEIVVEKVREGNLVKKMGGAVIEEKAGNGGKVRSDESEGKVGSGEKTATGGGELGAGGVGGSGGVGGTEKQTSPTGKDLVRIY